MDGWIDRSIDGLVSGVRIGGGTCKVHERSLADLGLLEPLVDELNDVQHGVPEHLGIGLLAVVERIRVGTPRGLVAQLEEALQIQHEAVLRVGRALQQRERIVREAIDQSALDERERRHDAVVHPHESLVREWMAIGLAGHGARACGSNVSKDQLRANLLCQSKLASSE